jgi:hypothetical protein
VKETGKPDNARIEIDVLTGASAGGMTAAMTALSLLFNGPGLGDPYDNPMYNSWVKDIDIQGLLARGADEDATHSILSSDDVIRISGKVLTPEPPLANVRHAAAPESGQISLGLAISNLNGVDYARPTMTGGQVAYTRHVDQRLFLVDGTRPYTKADWEPVRATAVACGAFPVAFRAQELTRSIADYPDKYLDLDMWMDKTATPPRPLTEQPFCYTDGGVFYNQPLGMAMNLVQALPGGRLQGRSRGYLFIAPQPKSSDAQEGIRATNANFKVLAQNLIGAVIGQSEFQDWVMAESFNEKLQLLDRRAAELKRLFDTHTLNPALTKPVTDALLPAFFKDSGAMEQQDLDAARMQLWGQYAGDYTGKFASAEEQSAWLDSVLVLELAADLHRKEEMYIFDFVADPMRLAGGGLFAFTGFFAQSYRDHDYDYGRTVAQAKLDGYAAQAGGLFEGLHWTKKPVRAIDQSLDNLQMGAVDEETREKVCAQMLQAADDLMSELGLNGLERWGAKQFLVKKQIEKMLSLSDG